MESLKQKCLDIADYLPQDIEVYDQTEGEYREECPCCVAAHLANYFDVCHEYDQDYIHGYQALARHLDIHVPGLENALMNCGAPENPFGTEEWDTHPRVVFRRLGDWFDVTEKEKP